MIDTDAINQSVNLIDLIGKYTTLKKCAANETCGPCVRCGGRDRMHVQKDKWFCRQCHEKFGDAIDFVMWMDNLDFQSACIKLGGRNLNASREELNKLAAIREQKEREQAAAEEEKQKVVRARLHQSHIWEAYHANLDAYDKRDLWRERGLPDEWQDYYKIGYCPPREWVTDDKAFISDSLTIPYFHYTKAMEYECVSLKHRLLCKDPPGGKYRPEMAGLGGNLYTPWYEEPIQEKVLIVEGEVKAQVVFSRLWRGDEVTNIGANISVVGIAGMNMKPELVAKFSSAEKIWICLDPDCYHRPNPCPKDWIPVPEKLKKIFGPDRCEIVNLPGKVDDLIVMGVLDTDYFIKLLS